MFVKVAGTSLYGEDLPRVIFLFEKGDEALGRFVRITVVSVVFVLLAAGSALAVEYTCYKDVCKGTDKRDTITGGPDNDKSQTFYGLRAGDILKDTNGDDDRDTMYGEEGDDLLNTADGDGRDILRGGSGYDVCIGDPNDEFKGCEDEIIRR
jgi:Ca2+-binding RTX toxin-like protein